MVASLKLRDCWGSVAAFKYMHSSVKEYWECLLFECLVFECLVLEYLVFEGAYSSVTHLASAVLPVRRSTERLTMQYVLDNTRMSASVRTYEQMVCTLGLRSANPPRLLIGLELR